MKKLALVLLLIASADVAIGQSSMTACYLSGSSTTCILPVNVQSMAGPANLTTSGYLSSGDWKNFNAAAAGVTSVTGTAPVVSSGGSTRRSPCTSRI